MDFSFPLNTGPGIVWTQLLTYIDTIPSLNSLICWIKKITLPQATHKVLSNSPCLLWSCLPSWWERFYSCYNKHKSLLKIRFYIFMGLLSHRCHCIDEISKHHRVYKSMTIIYPKWLNSVEKKGGTDSNFEFQMSCPESFYKPAWHVHHVDSFQNTKTKCCNKFMCWP
jgi:hypothetical protein